MSFYVNDITVTDPSTIVPYTNGILMAYEVRKTIAPFTVFAGDINTPVPGLLVYAGGDPVQDVRTAVINKLLALGIIDNSWPSWDGDPTNLIPNGIPQVYSIDPAFVPVDVIRVATDQTQPTPGTVPPNEQYTIFVKIYEAATAPVPFADELIAYIENEGNLQILSEQYKPVE